MSEREVGKLSGSASLSTTRGGSETDTFTIDLSTAAGKQAYGALVRGDTASAKSLSESSTSGVKHDLSEEARSSSSKGNADGKLEVGRSNVSAGVAARKDRDVVVDDLGNNQFRVWLSRQKEVSGSIGAGSGNESGTLSGGIELGGARGRDQSDVATFDLTKPGARAAMEAMKQGDMAPALKLASEKQGVVLEKTSDQVWTSDKLKGSLATKLGDGFTAGLSLYEEKIAEKDPRIADNAARKQLTQQAAAKGEKVTWHGSGGALEPGGGTNLTVGGIGVGFSAQGILEYSAVAPKTSKGGGTIAPNELPLNADKARNLQPGSEVVLHGAGSLAVDVSKGHGANVGVGPVTAGYSVGVKTQVKTSADVAVKVSRLDGDKVRVVVAERSARSGDVSLAAQAGLVVDKDKIPGGSALAGLVGGTLSNSVKKQVATKLTDFLSAKAEVGVTKEKAEREVAAYELDLSTASGRAAYDKLVKLDTTAAAAAAAQGGSGVSLVGTLDEKTDEVKNHAQVRILGANLHTSHSERRERVATLVNQAGTKQVTESDFNRETDGILTKGKVHWEAVQVTDQESGASERFLHLQLKDYTDKWTSHDELKRTERFIDAMGAKVTQKAIKNENPSWWNRNINPATHGKTTANADVYFTEGAMKQIAGADYEQAMQAYATSTKKLEAREKVPAWMSDDPALRREARQLLESYDPSQTGSSDSGPDQSQQYWRLTGQNTLQADHSAYLAAKDFAKFVDRAHVDKEKAMLGAFADLGAKRGFDFHATIGAMNELATDDVVLLNKLELTGKEATIRTTSEGAIEHPDTDVAATFE